MKAYVTEYSLKNSTLVDQMDEHEHTVTDLQNGKS